MLRIVRCTIHRHCHHCDCHYQKCQCRIHLHCCLQSNHHPVQYHLETHILQQVLKIVGVGCLWWCFLVTCKILCLLCLWSWRFQKLIWILWPTESPRHKFTVHNIGAPRTTRVNLCKPVVCAMLLLVTCKVSSSHVLFCTFMIRQNLLSCSRFYDCFVFRTVDLQKGIINSLLIYNFFVSNYLFFFIYMIFPWIIFWSCSIFTSVFSAVRSIPPKKQEKDYLILVLRLKTGKVWSRWFKYAIIHLGTMKRSFSESHIQISSF